MRTLMRRSALLLLLPALAASEPDSFGLGTGSAGALNVAGAQQINSYARVTAPVAPGDTSLAVSTTAGFAANGLVLVIQTTGLVPAPTSGDQTARDLSADPVGRFELARVSSLAAGVLNLTAPLLNSYAGNVTQVVTVPEYTTVTVTATGSIVAPAWNGQTGGMVAFLASGAVTNNGTISGAARGFRGGVAVLDGNAACPATLDYATGAGGDKGEGLGGPGLFGPTLGGRGNLATGGGGGNCTGAGGAGGSSAGSGGNGGTSREKTIVGGLGGSATAFSATDHLIPGGGGGAGQDGNGSGAVGGGIVFFRAASLAGTGTVSVDGASALAGSEGGGGGGAGGTIYARLSGASDCGGLFARGGNGGNSRRNSGPGGGGGGGRILLQSTGGACARTVTGGINGLDGPDTQGATPGSAGAVETPAGGFSTPASPLILTPAALTNNSNPLISGTAPVGTTVVVVLDGIPRGSSNVDGAGNWSLLPGALAEGPHTIEAWTRFQGVYSPKTTVTFSIDTVAPDATIVSGPPALTNNTSAVFSLSSSDLTATFECALDGASFSACGSAPSYTVTSQGAHSFQARAVDGAGNRTSPAATWTWTLDTVAPTATIVSGPAANTTDPNAAFSLSSTDGSATFECSLDGGAFAACSATPSWVIASDGLHTLDVRAVDPAGNRTTPEVRHSWTLDRVAPSAAIDSGPASPTNVATAIFALSSNEGTATFECSLDGGAYAACTANPSFGIAADGTHTLDVRAVDAAGNRTSPAARHTWVLDRIAPSAAVASGPASPTNNATAAFTLTSDDPGASFECSLDGGAFLACSSSPSYLIASDGPHTLDVRAVDTAGNRTTPSVRHSWTLDRVAPSASIVSGPAAFTNNPTASFTLNTTDGAATFECSLDGGAFAACSSTPSFAIATDGAHTLDVRAVDLAGNRTSPAVSHSWTLDRVAPSASIDSGPPALTNVATASFSLSSDDPGATFECSLDGGPFAACSATPSFTPPQGSHTLDVRAVDAAGNRTSPAVRHSWTLDTTAPSATIFTGPAAFTSNPTADFTLTSNDAGATFECSLDGGAFAACSATPSFVIAADGPHTLDVRAVDAAGNRTSPAVRHGWTLDRGVPSAMIVSGPASPTNVATASFTLTSDDPSATFECSLDGGAYAACSSNPSFTPASDGAHTLDARAVDAAGNRTSPAPRWSWTLDRGVPTALILTGPATFTSDANAAFTFSSDDPGATFECNLDGAGFAACSSAPSFAIASDGAHSLLVRAVDGAGNRTNPAASWSWTLDRVAPTASFTSGPAAFTSNATAAFVVSTNEAGATFECALDGGAFAACSSTPSYVIGSDGAHTLDVRAVDAAGNRTTPAVRWSWTLDRVAPSASFTSFPANPTNNATATFALATNDGSATFECSLDGAAFAACSAAPSFVIASDGAHTLQIRAVDAAGNRTDPAPSYGWTLDRVAPSAAIVSGPPALTNNPTAAFTLTVDAGATLECRLDGGAWAACSTTPSFAIAADGPHTLEVRGVDGALNRTDPPVSHAWTLDTAAPDVAIDSGPPALSNSSNAAFALSSTDGSATFECRLDGGAWAACPAAPSFTVADGSHTLQVRAVDPAGNRTTPVASYGWSVDTGAPSVSVVSGPPAFTNNPSASFQFASNDASATFECAIDSGAWAACPANATFSVTSDGAHTLDVRAVDTFGNRTFPTVRHGWTLDRVAPSASVLSGPSSPTNVTLAGFTLSSDDVGATFECSLNGASFGACSSSPSFVVAEGSHTLEARARDAAQNLTAPVASWSWTVDTTPPTTTLVSGPPALTNSTSATFSFSSNDPAATFECSLDGAGYAPCASNPTFTVAAGSRTLNVRARDAAGNVDPDVKGHAWTVDLTAPSVAINSGPADPSNAATAVFGLGSADATASFECSLDGAPFAACPASASFPVGEGSHTFAARAVDGAGNRTAVPATRAWTVDLTAPSTAIDTGPAALTNATSASFAVSSADPSATFQCNHDGAGFVPCGAAPSFGALADGAHSLRVRAVDPAGNVDPNPPSWAWTVDTLAPSTSIASAPPAVTSSANAAFAFTSIDPTATFECALDGGVYAPCPASSTFTVAEGPHTLDVRALDGAGNIDATPERRSWVVDQTPPSTQILSTPPALTNVTQAPFTFASEAGATFQCALDATAFAECSAVATFVVGEGSHTLRVRGVDAAGNVDPAPPSYAWVVDVTPPNAPAIVTPTANALSIASGILIQGTAEPGSTVELRYDGVVAVTLTAAADGTFSWVPPASLLADGPHAVSASAQDPAGNRGPSSGEVPFTVQPLSEDPLVHFRGGCGCGPGGESPTALLAFGVLFFLGVMRRRKVA